MEITKEDAKKLYPDSPDWFKKKLKDSFKTDLIVSWKDIDSYGDAVALRPVDDEDALYPTDSPYVAALKMLCHVAKVVNEEWKADWNDANQKKWEPVFSSSGSGFGFSGSGSVFGRRYSSAGSRLCFKEEARSDFVGKKFLKLFNILINNEQ